MIASSRYQPKPYKHGDPDTFTCPHCWTVFPFEDALYVGRHPELLGDPMLGPDVPSRFKPTRFTPEGQAIDPGGYPCLELACPMCHLEVPRGMSEFRSLFMSIVGMAQSGKSFFLTSLVWELRRVLSKHFAMSFTDVEMSLNAKLHTYEETLFLAKDPEAYVTLPKTEQQGDLYNRVSFDGVETLLPRPFLFALKPQRHHPNVGESRKMCRSVVLYDNAGEHFNPNQDTARQPGTMHMARSEALFFMFDPTQDPRFRALLAGRAADASGRVDPQLEPGWHTRRQDVCFSEAARRVRRHAGIPDGQKHRKLVVVVVNKLDLWGHLLKVAIPPEPYVTDPRTALSGLSVGMVDDVSFSVRALLAEICPEVVASVEDFAEHVAYVPVSTIGHSPVKRDGGLYVRPADVKPVWAAVPFLYAFARHGLVYRGTRNHPPGTPRARLLSAAGGLMRCALPWGGQVEVPARLAGKLLHNPRDGKAFVAPTPAPAAPAVEAVPTLTSPPTLPVMPPIGAVPRAAAAPTMAAVPLPAAAPVPASATPTLPAMTPPPPLPNSP